MKKKAYGAGLLDEANIAALQALVPVPGPVKESLVTEKKDNLPSSEISLDLIDDSPYQPRLHVKPEGLRELMESMNSLGRLDDPIKVRPVGGRFELIRGHRRVVAARELKWTTITAIVQECDDQSAKLSVLVNNTGREDLTDYELGRMYKFALDNKLAANQGEIAALFATNQSAVSGCIAMLKLPPELLNCLDHDPSSFGRNFASNVMQMINKYPDHRPMIIRGALKIANDKGNQNSLEGWIKQQLSQEARSKLERAKPVIVTDNRGHQVFSAIPNQRRGTVTIKVSDSGIDLGAISQLIGQALSEFITKEQ